MESLLDASVREVFAARVERALSEGDTVVGVGCETLDRGWELGFSFDDFGDAGVLARPGDG